jgi:hypothetical protein
VLASRIDDTDIALVALTALGLSGAPVHEPVHHHALVSSHPVTVRNLSEVTVSAFVTGPATSCRGCAAAVTPPAEAGLPLAWLVSAGPSRTRRARSAARCGDERGRHEGHGADRDGDEEHRADGIGIGRGDRVVNGGGQQGQQRRVMPWLLKPAGSREPCRCRGRAADPSSSLRASSRTG